MSIAPMPRLKLSVALAVHLHPFHWPIPQPSQRAQPHAGHLAAHQP